jgi:hypothetical protein
MEPFAQVCGGNGETFDLAVPSNDALTQQVRAATPRP